MSMSFKHSLSSEWQYPERAPTITQTSVTAYVYGNARYGKSAAVVFLYDEAGALLHKFSAPSESAKSSNVRAKVAAAVAALESLDKDSSLLIRTSDPDLHQSITEWLPNWEKNAFRKTSGRPVAGAEIWARFVKCRDERNLKITVELIDPDQDTAQAQTFKRVMKEVKAEADALVGKRR